MQHMILTAFGKPKKAFGHSSFNVVGAHVWNSLPSYLRQDSNYKLFVWQLTTFCLGFMTHCDCLTLICTLEIHSVEFILVSARD